MTVQKIDKRRGSYPEEWAVYDNDAPEGEKLVASFYGPKARQRASEYAAQQTKVSR